MFTTLLLLTAIGHAISAPTGDFTLHEKRNNANLDGRTRVDGNAILPIRIALAQSNLENGYEYLLDVSDPRSVQYGKHWTTEEIHKRFAPSGDAVDNVMTWLHENGYNRDQIASSASNGWLAFESSARDAESLFSTQYYEEKHEDGSIGIACDEYYLPRQISEHVDYVLPGTIALPLSKRTRAKQMSRRQSSAHSRRSIHKAPNVSPYDTSTCGKWITPICLQALYGIPNATINQPENALGIFEDVDTYDQDDINLYWRHYAPWVPNGTHPTLQSINGAKAPVPTIKGGVESTLDFDLAYALLYPQEVVLYQTTSTQTQQNVWIDQYGPAGNGSIATLFLPLIEALDGKLCTQREKESGADCGTVELTNVLSVSYGYSELQTPERAAKRICAEFMKLALKGHTLLFASQDEGVSQRPAFTVDPTAPVTNGCINSNDVEDLFVNGTVFNPTFPASCPFVTAVGATQLTPDESIGDPERAMHVHLASLAPLKDILAISSGGGVSNYFSVPAYQTDAVNEYFSTYSPSYPTYRYEGRQSVGANGGIHAVGGRGYPDVSANGAHMPQFLNGTYLGEPEEGTSLSTPIVASMITMINQQRTLAGKGPVGFINPVIYQHPEAFTDITRGNNPGCGTNGFPASQGWDPITGLGTPIYPKLLEVFMELP